MGNDIIDPLASPTVSLPSRVGKQPEGASQKQDKVKKDLLTRQEKRNLPPDL